MQMTTKLIELKGRTSMGMQSKITLEYISKDKHTKGLLVYAISSIIQNLDSILPKYYTANKHFPAIKHTHTELSDSVTGRKTTPLLADDGGAFFRIELLLELCSTVIAADDGCNDPT
jgi:hypothetical protein